MSTKALCAATELKVADHVQSGPRKLADVARDCNARPDRLEQVMRTLSNNGIFSYDAVSKLLENNRASTLLLTDHWTQWRNWVDTYGNEFYDMARGIPEACRSDSVRCPAQVNYDTDDTMFRYFADQGWLPKFHKTLDSGAIAQAPGILYDYPWEQLAPGKFLDIGGGGGGLIALVLREHKALNGAILDTSTVIDQTRHHFHSPDGRYNDVGDRISPHDLIAGDFFQHIPPSDVYTMKWVLHDWDDEKARVILRNIRESIIKTPKSRLIILESVLRDGHTGRISRYADMNMMVAVGGKERDESEWRRLAQETGWELRQIYPLRNAWPSAIEFIPVWAPEQIRQVNGNGAPLTEPVEKGQVTACMRFLEPWSSSRGIPFVRISPAPGYNRMNFAWQDYSVQIQNSRSNKGDFNLDTHGFAYFDDEIPRDTVEALRGNDSNSVKDLYYEHVEQFVKRITGAPRVILFDHTLRKRRLELSQTKNDDGKEQPATMVTFFFKSSF